MRLPKGSLRNKIIARSFVPTAIILAAVASVSLYAYQRVTENLVIERDRELTRLSAKLLATELAAYADPSNDQFLAIFDGAFLFSADGSILAAEPVIYEREQPNWFVDLSLNGVLQSSEPVYSNVLVDTLHGEEVVLVILPFVGPEGQSNGGIAGLFRLDPAADSALYRSVEKLRRGESNCIYLIDSNGRVIYHSNRDYIGEDFSSQVVVSLVLNQWAGAYRTEGFEGEDIVASFAPVSGTPWGLVMEESWAALSQSSRRYGQFLFALLALGIVLPTVIVWVGVRRITQPITELIGAAQEIASGHFGQRIKATSGDEMEELAEQFNRMASQLQESYAHLERKVDDRTKELATLNAIAAEVSQSLNLEEILSNALHEVLQATNMDCGQAFHLEEDTQTLISVAHHGLSEEFVHQTARLPLNASLAGLAATAGQPMVRRTADYPDGEAKDLTQQEGLYQVVAIPLIAHGSSVGAINLSTRSPRSVTPEELSLLDSIGHQIGVAVENARLYEQAQELAVVKERNRLARDLHDSVTQALYGVTLYSEAAARQLLLGQPDLAAQHLCEIRETAQESLREMRLLVFELRLPLLKREGLAAALQARLEAVEGRVGLITEFSAEGNGRLPSETEEGLYRIAQEALNNTLHHAQAGQVSVRLSQSEHVVALEIVDDGLGFDPAATQESGGFGLHSMRERATRLGGILTVQSYPGQGTKIRVEVCP